MQPLPPQKAMKPSFPSPTNSQFFPQVAFRHKLIKPMPLVRIKLQDQDAGLKISQQLVSKGYRYISKGAVTGKSSMSLLKKINQSKCLKTIKNFEFDPYLCEKSGVKSLCRVFKRLRKSIKSLNLIVRRFDERNELNLLTQWLYRLSLLQDLRIEFPSTKKMNNQGMKLLGKSLRKCYLLKKMDYHFISLNQVSQVGFIAVAHNLFKLRKLESHKAHVRAFYTPQNICEDLPSAKGKLPKVKDYSLRISRRTGWTSMTDGSCQFLPSLFRSYPQMINPTRLSLALNKFPISTETIHEIAKALPQLSNIRYVFLEFSCCRLGELEMMILANGIIDCKQIQHLNLKIIENTPIAMEYILQFIKLLDTSINFPKLDLFFKKLFYSEWQTEEAIMELSGMKNMKYEMTKQSLHLYKN